MRKRGGASDDVAFSNVDSESIHTSFVWLGEENDEIPPSLASVSDIDWKRCSASSTSTRASFHRISDKDLAAGLEDEGMPAASTAPAAACSDAVLPERAATAGGNFSDGGGQPLSTV